MRICLFNSPGKPKGDFFDKTIWCPLSEDIVHIVRFLRNTYEDNISLHIESVFRKYFELDSEPDIIYFEIDKISAPRKERLVAFYSQSDTLAGNTYRIISGNTGYRYINYVPAVETEDADTFFIQKKIPFLKYSFRHLKESRPDIFVLYNDWTKAAIRIISQCHRLKIPVVCIQESLIDFGDSFKRMQYADDVIIQGIRSATLLPRKHFFLAGNPRYEGSSAKGKSAEYALINCNFTYGIFEEVRYDWLDDVTAVLDDLGISYLISQHPRDTGDLSKYKKHLRSSGDKVTKQIDKAGVLITRFSSLIHESLTRKVPVVYYNPHDEQMHYDFGFNPEFLVMVKGKSFLKESVATLYNKNISGSTLELYLNIHCLPVNTKPVSSINYLLSQYYFSIPLFSFKDLVRLVFYHPFIVKYGGKIKKALYGVSESED